MIVEFAINSVTGFETFGCELDDVKIAPIIVQDSWNTEENIQTGLSYWSATGREHDALGTLEAATLCPTRGA